MGEDWFRVQACSVLNQDKLGYPQPDGSFLLGQSIITACELDLLLGEVFKLQVHVVSKWASGIKYRFPARKLNTDESP